MNTIHTMDTSTDTAKLMAAAIPALLITFLLFALMQQLIGADRVSVQPPVEAVDHQLHEPRKDSQANIIIRTLPEPPKPLARPDSLTAETIGESGPFIELSVDPVLPGLELTDAGEFSLPDKTATAMVRIDPRYPVEAAKNGIEGWVKLSFSIDTTGAVIDVEVLDAEPKRIFDREAVKALRSWKYQPQLVDGKAVVQRHLQVQLDFSLDKG
ncbi:energy transducer TonB [Rheinheimera sp. 1928-s]|uniref:energy transducer TonB n=1 Tax=Rheinheimera sp. 1928-s TaxID=3033803 RepID=UPI00263556CD|nr:energy transducer TonB [Rheinheimera sp. 1928-s]MDF3126767.1 energy transducer TonB [Rheinheimera sp. 1928-s]